MSVLIIIQPCMGVNGKINIRPTVMYNILQKGYNLLDNFWRAVKINEPLVYPHLVSIPSLGPFSTGSLPSGNPQNFRGHAHRAFYLQLFLLSPLDQISTHCQTKKSSSSCVQYTVLGQLTLNTDYLTKYCVIWSQLWIQIKDVSLQNRCHMCTYLVIPEHMTNTC